MLRSAMGYLAAADATAMAAETQAQCLQDLEQANAMGTAARASILAAFTAGQGYSADADYSPKAWLIHKTGITKGAAVAYTAWVRRAAGASPGRGRAGGRGDIGVGRPDDLRLDRTSCPQDCRQAADAILVERGEGGDGRAGPGRAGRGDLRPVAARGRRTRKRIEAFEDRSVTVEATFDGAGVLSGDLTPECASIVTAVLDALSAPAGPEDDRSQAQRYHDALHEAMHRLVTAGLLPERAGQPVKAWVHISLADLMVLDGSSALLEEWTSRVRAQWAAHRAAASAGGGDGGAWLDGDAATAIACDAAMAPVVTGEVNPGRPGGPGAAVRRAGPAPPPPPAGDGHDDTGGGGGQSAPAPGHHPRVGSRRASDHRQSRRPAVRARAGWRRSCGAGSSAPGWAGRACRWTSATPRPSRPRSATRSSCATGTASGPGGAASPRRRARSTTSSTRPTAARPASEIVFYYAGSTTRS